MHDINLNIRIPSDLKDKLDAYAAERYTSTSEVVRQAIINTIGGTTMTIDTQVHDEYQQHVLENGDAFAPDHAIRVYEDGTVAFGQMQIWGEQHQPIAAYQARDKKRWSCSFMERSSKEAAEQYVSFMEESGGWNSEITDFYRSHIS